MPHEYKIERQLLILKQLFSSATENIKLSWLTWQQDKAKASEYDGENPVQDGDRGDENHKDEPEPHGQVHLLVDHVLTEDTEAVMELVPARGSHVGHGAADLQGEGGAKGVYVNLLFLPGHLVVSEEDNRLE